MITQDATSTFALLWDSDYLKFVGYSCRPAELLSTLERYPGPPGRLTNMIKSLQEQDLQAERGLIIAVLSIGNYANDIERTVIEEAMVANWKSYFLFNEDMLIAPNGLTPSQGNKEELGRATVRALLRNDLIRQGETVIDIGSGHGIIASELAAKGIAVEAIEPGRWDPIVFPDTKKLTAQSFTRSFPDKKFSVALLAGFNPNGISCAITQLAATSDIVSQVCKLTTSRALFLISSVDPGLISHTSEVYLLPKLESKFSEVEYLSADTLGEDYSVGGHLGLFKCSGPKNKSTTKPVL
ncbi:hypothetical protein GQ44DRAFT_770461 [Phaeosphaeriaceae sp. PMI808]|nr:hypothetical protein GQ44DRAFT_770461 [Phaeosphaeriaceae sp. PMI808]